MISGAAALERDFPQDVATDRRAASTEIRKAPLASNAIHGRTAASAIDSIIGNCTEAVKGALVPGSNGWKELFPGKYLLQRFSADFGLRDWVLQNLIIDAFVRSPQLVPSDLRDVVGAVYASS
jgi:hypothetical protein